jgi:hypothetical protein
MFSGRDVRELLERFISNIFFIPISSNNLGMSSKVVTYCLLFILIEIVMVGSKLLDVKI